MFYCSQIKFHYAITGKTAAQIVYESDDSNKPFIGLKSWKQSTSGRVLKSDTTIAKNYLNEKEINQFLEFNNFEVLEGKGTISHQ